MTRRPRRPPLRRRRRRTRRTAVGLVGAAVLTAATASGCAGEVDLPTAPQRLPRVELDTPALRAEKARLGVADCEPGAGSSDLPALELPCLGGGPAVDLSRLEGPLVISLWASWCGPCRAEMPLLQRLHERAGDRVPVIGVDYQDSPDLAMDLLDETGATFPMLADPAGSLNEVYPVRGMPSMALVDGDGEVRFLSTSVRTYRELTDLVAEHTGVSVGSGPARG